MLRVACSQSIKPAHHCATSAVRQLSVSINLLGNKSKGDSSADSAIAKRKSASSTRIDSNSGFNSLVTIQGLESRQKVKENKKQKVNNGDPIMEPKTTDGLIDVVLEKSSEMEVVVASVKGDETSKSKPSKYDAKKRKNNGIKNLALDDQVESDLGKMSMASSIGTRDEYNSLKEEIASYSIEGSSKRSFDYLASLIEKSVALPQNLKRTSTPKLQKYDEGTISTTSPKEQKTKSAHLNLDPKMREKLKSIMSALFDGITFKCIEDESFQLRLKDPANAARLNEIRRIIKQDPALELTSWDVSCLLSHLVDEDLEAGNGVGPLKKETEIFVHKMIEHSATWDETKMKDIFAVPPNKPFFPDYDIMEEEVEGVSQDRGILIGGGSVTQILPQNGFETQMLNEDQEWQFPVDNQADIEGDEHSFADHVFLDRHLNDFPQVEPVQKYMELVITGLQQNPFLSYHKKINRIKWYKNYFAQLPEEALQ